MSSESKHIERAENNESFYNQFNLATTPFIDWAITALFYSALHYIDAYLAKYPAGGIHPASHGKREKFLACDNFTQNIYPSYRELRDRSEDARYNLISFSPPFVALLEAQEFQTIRKIIRPYLGLS